MDYDLATILETQELPSRADLPGLPNDWTDNPKNSFGGGTLAKIFATRSESVDQGGCFFRRRVTCSVPSGESCEALGDGNNLKSAEKAAYIHLMCVLHAEGLLKRFLGSASLDQKVIAEEKDAKIDIYNYAARFGAVPHFTETKLTAQKSRHGRGGGNLTEVTIELPEQGIKVSGVGTSVEIAEVAAGLNFKSEAEKYQATQGTDSLIIRDALALGVGNAKTFFDFCRSQRVDLSAAVEVSPGKNKSYAQAFLNNEPVGAAVSLGKKKQAEDVAYLVAAIEAAKRQPALLAKYQKSLRQGGGRYIPPAPMVDLPIQAEVLDVMEETIRRARDAGLEDQLAELEAHEQADERRPLRRSTLAPSQIDVRSDQLSRQLELYDSDPSLAQIRQIKADLPMNQHADEVLSLLDENQFSIVIGATGSGKTTQVPQIVLDDAIRKGEGGSCNVICTQPRRIAATSVGRRVAEERAQKLQDSVGYHVRYDPKPPRLGGSITYCTTGILLQQLQHSPDEILDTVSHLVIDEVHERDILIDFLLTIVKKAMATRMAAGKPCPKIVLMSATMDSDLFSSYFTSLDATGEFVATCPTLRVPGRLFPVTEKYLDGILDDMKEQHGAHSLSLMNEDRDTQPYLECEAEFAKKRLKESKSAGSEEVEDETVIDWKRERIIGRDGEASASTENDDARVPTGLVASTIAHIVETTSEGAILTFLPGLDEILNVQDMLTQQRIFGVDISNESRYKMFLLHSSVQDSQREVFNPVPPGCRKIILATNIAETSVTIPDVQYVVDAGKLREKQYDQMTRITKLQCTWISKSNAKQRAGRAGRVQNGHYYGLFTKARKDSLRAVGLPEILRSDLQKVCLDVKAQRFKTPVRQFLADAIEPPSSAAIDKSMNSLIDLDCLTEDEKLTALGRLLASLPVHPSLGKMIVLGVIFRCLDPMLIISAGAEDRDLFVNPHEHRARAQACKRSFLRGSDSDHIAFLNAFRELRHVLESRGQFAQRDFGMNNFLHLGAFRNIANAAQQIEQVFVEAGLIPNTPSERRVDWQYGDPSLNANSHSIELIKALTLAGLHPNLAVRTNTMLLRAPRDPNVLFHPGSVNAPGKIDSRQRGHDDAAREQVRGQLYAYSVMAKSNDGNSTFLRTTSRVTPLMAALFGGQLTTSEQNRRVLDSDGWLPLRVDPGWVSARGVVRFRDALERMQTDAFRDLASAQPLAEHPVREIFAEALTGLLEGKSRPAGRAIDGTPRRDRDYDDRDDSHYRRPSGDRRKVVDRDEIFDAGFDMVFGGGDSYRPPARNARAGGSY